MSKPPKVGLGSTLVIARPKALTFAQLDALAGTMSDNAAAERMNAARSALFKTIFNRSKSAA